jgi:SAM-dependent methyltransferase
VGVDIWRRRDQNGNNRAATERNATLEGVSHRVSVVDADARDMPFPSASFDVVVSNLAFHNILSTEGRNQALSEAVRVLRDGRRMTIVDEGAERYPEVLQDGRPRSSPTADRRRQGRGISSEHPKRLRCFVANGRWSAAQANPRHDPQPPGLSSWRSCAICGVDSGELGRLRFPNRRKVLLRALPKL